jgi:TP901 family phage tail tape measure protein
MANISRTIDVIFNGKDSITPATRKISRGLHALEAGVDKTIEKADALADAFKKVTVAGAALGATLVGLALNEYKKYQDAWTDLVKVTEDGEAGLTGVSDEIRRVSRQYGEDITAITKSVFEFKRSGLEVSESLLATENAIKLVIAGNAEMAESTQFLKQILAGFKLDADETTHIVDVLNIISDKYNTTVTELGIALSRISPSAEKMNVSLEKSAALLTPIIEVFGSGEEASTAYRRGLLRLVSSAPSVLKALDDLGVEQREGPNKELREGEEILKDYIAALQNLTKEQKLENLILLFNERQASKLAESMGQLAKVEEIELLASSVKTQYTTDQVAIKMATLKKTIDKLVVSTRDLGRSLGEKLEIGALKAVSGIRILIDSIGDAARDGMFAEVFNQFNNLGEDLGVYFVQVAAMLPKALSAIDYSGLIDSIQDLLGTVNASLEGLDLTKPEDLAYAIQFVIDTMESGIRVADGMVTTYRNVKNQILSVIKVFNSLGEEQKKTFGEALATADVMEYVGKIFGGILTKMEAFANVSTNTVTAAAGAFRLIGAELDVFGNTAANVWLGLRILVLKSIDFITLGASTIIKERLAEVTEAYNTNRDEIIDASYKMTEGYNMISRGLKGVEESSGKALSKLEQFALALQNTPKDVKVAINLDIKEDAIDPEVKRVAALIEESHQKQSALGGFKLSTKVELEQEQDLKDFLQGTGKWSSRKDSVFDDSAIAKVEAQSIALQRDLRAVAEAGEDAGDVELDVPDDTKFQAAQQKLLKEIDTNASIMEARLKSISDIAESNSAVISSSFESVSDSISSSGDTLTELYNTLASGKLGMATFAVQRSIREEEERRQEAFELQKQLTTAQIDLIKQRASAMSAGDPLITVSGDGLQPHLEAFMWEILSAIQVRVNETYGNFLLGIGAS